MRAFISLFVFCFCQCDAAPMSGIKLPLTSIACSTTLNDQKALSLSFSQKDSIEPKINMIGDINLKSIDTNPFSKEEKKKRISVSKLLEKIGLIDPKTKNRTLIKTQNLDNNVVKEETLLPVQNNLSKTKDSDDKNIGNEKNTINYSIKVLSPPAVFGANARNLPQATNKFKTMTKKNSNNISEYPQASHPSKSQVKRAQEVNPKKQNLYYHCNNDGRENTRKPKLQDKTDIVGSNSRQMLDRERKGSVENTLNEIESPLKSIYGLKDNRNLLKCNPESALPLPTNDCEVQTNFLDVPLKIDGKADAIDLINEEKNSIYALDREAEYKMFNKNLNRFYNDEHKPYANNLLSGQLSQKLHLNSNPTPECDSPTNKVRSSNDHVSPSLSYSLDKLITFFTSKFLSVLPNISADCPDIRQGSFTPLTTLTYTNLPEKIFSSNDIYQTAYESIPSGNDLEFTEYLHIEQENIIVKDAVCKESLAKLSAPHLSTLTINYTPYVESSNEIVIIM